MLLTKYLRSYVIKFLEYLGFGKYDYMAFYHFKYRSKLKSFSVDSFQYSFDTDRGCRQGYPFAPKYFSKQVNIHVRSKLV